jgi:Bacteriophage tail sheath protein
LLTHCEKLKDRVAILDSPEVVEDIRLLTEVGTVTANPSSRPPSRARTGAEATPTASTQPAPSTPAAPTAPTATTATTATAQPRPSENGGLRARQSDGGYGAFYFPWITVRDPLSPTDLVDVPPSGHIAGIWARTDTMRGVHKAPANEVVRSALNVRYQLTREEQGELNQAGVNCIRFFTREGIRVWGARTLASRDSESKYVNVRRFLVMMEESIVESTRWIVFEPNDATLWKSIRRDIGAFLTRLWMDGALMGSTPAEAFYVKCDAETNPPELIQVGQVTTEVGVAPTKPAEFIVFRISQYTAGAEVEMEVRGGISA